MVKITKYIVSAATLNKRDISNQVKTCVADLKNVGTEISFVHNSVSHIYIRSCSC